MRVLFLLAFVSFAVRAEIFTYWIEPCSGQKACSAESAELAEWALAAWKQAAGSGLDFRKAEGREAARLRFYWSDAGRGGLYGEARPILVGGKSGAELVIRAPSLSIEDPLLAHAILYLTCVHELGHALGLTHTRAFEDIMYSFGYGGDIEEYFGRYRRKLKGREDIRKHWGLSQADIRRIAELYNAK